MIAEVYDAFKEAGVSEEKALKAAQTLAGYDRELADIKADLRILKWGQSVTFAGVLAILLKLFV